MEEAESGDDEQEKGSSEMALGVTFLNKHCFVSDMKKSKVEEGPTLLSRSHEIRLEVLE